MADLESLARDLAGLRGEVERLKQQLTVYGQQTPWNMAQFIGIAKITSAQTGIGTSATDITSLSVSWTALANREYLLMATVSLTQNTSAGVVQARIADGSSNQLQSVSFNSNTGETKRLPLITFWAPGAGAVTAKVMALTNANTVDFAASSVSPGHLVVFDLGPTGSPT